MILTVCQTLMAVPTVVVGLLLYAMFFRQGPLGPLGLFTPAVMAIGQTVLILPLLVSLVSAALGQADPRLREEAWALGAGAASSSGCSCTTAGSRWPWRCSPP